MTQKLETIMDHPLNGYSETAQAHKTTFHRLAAARLRALAAELGISKGEYDVRNNPAGIAVSGEVTLHTDTLYVQVSQSCMGRGSEVLFRSCNGRSDYRGGSNHFAPAAVLDDVAQFALYLNDTGRFGPFPADR